jgi:hypothetical protein
MTARQFPAPRPMFGAPRVLSFSGAIFLCRLPDCGTAAAAPAIYA